MAFGIDKNPRISWNAYNLETTDGIKIEVKSSSYIQTWKQKDFSKSIINIPVSYASDYKQNLFHNERKRHANVYIFALLAHKEQSNLNPLNLDQWEFYVLATKQLSEIKKNQKSITLNLLKRITNCAQYNGLKEEITNKNKLNK